MGEVVCATRAGEHSRLVHRAAFARIEQSDDSLTFVHVVGGEDFEAQTESMRRAIETEVGWLVETLVRLAQQQTSVEDHRVRTAILGGDPAGEIIDFLRASEAQHLILGRPRSSEAGTFPGETFSEFLHRLDDLGVTVELVETGE